ncbi:MAG: hypothetical protein IKD07_07095, partial [Clostridia bacterium]|nr:hypothetical protein [Clostridia bacterium]
MMLFFFIFSILSVSALVIIHNTVLLFHKKRPRNERRLTPHLTWCVMTAAAAFFWFFPYFWQSETAENLFLRGIKTVVSVLQGIIRIFAVDETYADVMESVAALGVETPVFEFYSVIGIFLYFTAPVLTFGFILSLFKNIHAYSKYYTYFGSEVHIFSELNERSLALAKSIVEKREEEKRCRVFKPAPLIIFADILDKNEEEHLDLVADAKEIGALLFRQDITAIHFKRKRQNMAFYLISDDETEKIAHMEHIIKRYRSVSRTKLYLFSDEEESKCFLDSYPEEEKKQMRLDVIRVNDIRSLIYHNLDENGIRLFERAHLIEDGEREIHAVIVGFGKYGRELTKALLWYCQLPGYRIKISVFDEDADAEDRFKAACPEIKVGIPYRMKNDMHYEIRFTCCKAGTESFYQSLSALSPITYVFVSLGKDHWNISASMGIRSRLAKLRQYPDVETVVYNSSIKNRMGVDWEETAPDPKEYRNLHKIHIIGDLESFYSNRTVINSQLIDAGFSVHYRYRKLFYAETPEIAKKTFYMDDYGFFSSVAKALHARLRKKISEKLNANDPQAREAFAAFVPTSDANGKEIRDERYWNRFVLENTVDMQKAQALSEAIGAYNKKLKKVLEKPLYPYRATPGEIEELDRLGLTCTYGEACFSSAQAAAIAKSAAELEHIRWNAYMRAEGFSYIEDFQKAVDQPLKMHVNLTPCEKLCF